MAIGVKRNGLVVTQPFEPKLKALIQEAWWCDSSDDLFHSGQIVRCLLFLGNAGHALATHPLDERSEHKLPSTWATTERHSLPNHCFSPILPFHSETSYTSQPITSLFKLTPLRHVDTVISAARPIFDIERAA